jgi:hypothetical protein
MSYVKAIKRTEDTLHTLRVQHTALLLDDPLCADSIAVLQLETLIEKTKAKLLRQRDLQVFCDLLVTPS